MGVSAHAVKDIGPPATAPARATLAARGSAVSGAMHLKGWGHTRCWP